MSRWKTVPIGELVDSVKTWNPLRANPEESFDYIDLGAVDQATKTIIGARETVCSEAPSRARQLVSDRDVLVSTVRPNLNGVAKITPEYEGATASTGFCVLRPCSDSLDSNYLFHWVKSPQFVTDLVGKATGASYPAVSDRIIRESPIPFPPLAEQRRIAAILDQADALRAARREALAQLESLIQSIFIEMFGDITANQKKFPKMQIGSIAKITSGSTPGRASEGYYGGTIPWVKTTEVSGQNIYSTDEKLTEAGLKAMRGKLHPIDSIMVAMYGQGQTRGRSALLKVKAACNQACGVIYPSQDFLPIFMFHQIQLSYNELRAMARGGNQENLNLQLLGAFEVLLPPIDLQQIFSTRVQAIDNIKSMVSAALDELDALFLSLQYRAFRGEL